MYLTLICQIWQIIAHGNNFNPVFNLEINTQLTYFILISATDTEGWIIVIFGIVLDILFDIWTIYVAKKAIKEIKDDQKTTSPEPVVLSAQDSNNEQQIGNQILNNQWNIFRIMFLCILLISSFV